MREPAFWQQRFSLMSLLLMPVGAVYGLIAGIRLQGKGLDAGVPVFCVGNYHLGGAGKTPTVLALTQLLRDLGETPVVLSRGYGGRLKGPVTVDPERHDASDVGDEPLMLAATVPVVVSRDRKDGVALARSRGASVILMDDGFQNPSIAKDVSLIVIDGRRGLGNSRIFPAGPLRAPLSPQLDHTDAMIVIGDGIAASNVAAMVGKRNKPVLSATLKPAAQSLARVAGQRVLAFAGIGDPAKFFRTLREYGVEVVHERAFADHHPFSSAEISELAAEADRDDLMLVTTEKDMARLGAGKRKPATSREIISFAVTLEFDELGTLRRFVIDRLFQARQKKFGSGR